MLYTNKDIENVLKKHKDSAKSFISSHLIYSKYLYCGIIDNNMMLDGLGILIDFEGEIKVGEFK